MDALLASSGLAPASLAWISLGALGVVIVASCFTRVHPGILSIVLASAIGLWLAPALGKPIGFKAVVAGFPADLFLTLSAVTLLFSQAQVNGTLDLVAAAAVRSCRGRTALVPPVFFLLSFGLASIGAGNIAATALLAPAAMATGRRMGINALLMCVMVTHGSLAGGLSPIAPTGVIAGTILTEKLGLAASGWRIYLDNLLANAVVSLAALFLLGRRRPSSAPEAPPAEPSEIPRFETRHRATLAVVACLVIAVVLLKVPVAVGAFTGVLILSVFRLADEDETFRQVPWAVVVMVCGVSVLTSLLEQTGGTDLFTRLVGRVSGPRSVTGVIAFLTGLISTYSSTSGVVLPAFLPAAAGLAREAGGADPMAVASSIIVGGHLVDSSPLSTLGALCLASAGAEERSRLFPRLMAWGLSMTVVGAVICYVFFGLL